MGKLMWKRFPLTPTGERVMTLSHPSEPSCRLCELKESRAGDSTHVDESTVVAHIGESACVLIRRDRKQILMAPVDHVGRLTGLPPAEMAHFLASLRRVVLALRIEQHDGELVTEEMPGAVGHVVIRLAPTADDATELFESGSLLEALLRV